MNHPAKALPLTDEDRQILERWIRAHSTSQQVVKRARIILLAAEGMSNTDIAIAVGFSRPIVIERRKRFLAEGVNTLTKTRPGRGAKPKYKKGKIQEIVEATLHTKPKNATHWSCRTMAKEQGVSASTVHRIWKAHGLQPHRVETFKISQDAHGEPSYLPSVNLLFPPHSKLWGIQRKFFEDMQRRSHFRSSCLLVTSKAYRAGAQRAKPERRCIHGHFPFGEALIHPVIVLLTTPPFWC